MGKRKKGNFQKKRWRYLRIWGVAALALLCLLLGIFTYRHQRKFFDQFTRKSKRTFSLLYIRLKDFVFSPPLTPLNERESDFFWSKKFDLALQKSLSAMEVSEVFLTGEGTESSCPIRRLIEYSDIASLFGIQQVVFCLVQDHEGKIFGTQEEVLPQAEQLVIHLGRAEAQSCSYILVFKKKLLAESETKQGPVVALVIDDLGYNLSRARSLFTLNVPLTVSILPHHQFSHEVAQEAHQNFLEVILHLPMEPHQCEPKYLEKNTLLTQMSKKEILEILDSDLQDIPWAVGVNNHMGSLMLEDERSMGIILKELKSRGLYFLDSRTTQKSVGYKMAQKFGIPSAYRHVFLDHKKDLNYIEGQIEILIKKALKQGKAIGIGHLHPKTIKAIKRSVSKFEEKGIILVTLSKVLE